MIRLNNSKIQKLTDLIIEEMDFYHKNYKVDTFYVFGDFRFTFYPVIPSNNNHDDYKLIPDKKNRRSYLVLTKSTEYAKNLSVSVKKKVIKNVEAISSYKVVYTAWAKHERNPVQR